MYNLLYLIMFWISSVVFFVFCQNRTILLAICLQYQFIKSIVSHLLIPQLIPWRERYRIII